MLQGVDPGFDPRNLVTVNLSLPRAKYADAGVARCVLRGLAASTCRVAGGRVGRRDVEHPVWRQLVNRQLQRRRLSVAGGPAGPWGDQRIVTPGFHEAMKIKLLKGRLIAPSDREGAPKVVVVDDEMVKRYWPNTDPIGKRITFDDE